MFFFHTELEIEPGEQVIRKVRMHWFFFLGRLIPFAFFAAVPFAIPYLLQLASAPLGFTDNFPGWSAPLARLALGLWLLVIWSAAFDAFTKYFLNIWVLTTHRIIDIRQRSFFDRGVSSLFLDRVEDVTINTTGFFNSVLHIGTINVQTAGAIDQFTMDNVPDPEGLRDAILTHVAQKAA